MFLLDQSTIKSRASWPCSATRLHSVIGFGLEGIESIRRSRSNLETTDRMYRHRSSLPSHPSLHMSPTPATSTWKPSLKSGEKSPRIDNRCNLDFLPVCRKRPACEDRCSFLATGSPSPDEHHATLHAQFSLTGISLQSAAAPTACTKESHAYSSISPIDS